MADKLSPNFHVEYMEVTQHWSPGTEAYAGGDALVTFLHQGWELHTDVTVETKWYTGMRQGLIYHMTLTRDDEQLAMPVINNPYVTRLINEHEFKIHEMADEHAYSDR